MSPLAGRTSGFGAWPSEGRVAFRVWAPASERVEVVWYGGEGAEAGSADMEPEADGYFSAEVSGLGAGTRYRYRLDGGAAFPDPASRSQPDGVHGPSEVVDPEVFAWSDDDWGGCDPERLVIYELHVGTFSRAGTFDGVRERLDHLRELGVTALEIMPIADFPGVRNWGYDGVDLYAPAASYGGVEGFKRLVDAAHRAGLGVILDVVYNHFGPEGNYLPAVTGGRFFTSRHNTPWGDGINFDGSDSRPVRDFVIGNALYWLTEYHVDGLRLDATHAIVDDSETHLLAELADRVHGLEGHRRILIAEDDRNERTLLLDRESGGFGIDAVWADDLHHQLRRAAAGDSEGYFARYSGSAADIARTLRHGWWRPSTGEDDGAGSPDAQGIPASTAGLAPGRFVHCLQNHDQVGNRALGERLNHQVEAAVFRALTAILLVAPSTPMIWMGQEWSASSPFLYFTDHPEELGRLVTEGRREEFKRFSAFRDPALRQRIPDPQDVATFEASILDWDELSRPEHAGMLALYRALLEVRRGTRPAGSVNSDDYSVTALDDNAVAIRRHGLGAPGESLLLVANLRGTLYVDLAADETTASAEGAGWEVLLSTEEARFGGAGEWGGFEGPGTLRLDGPGAIILRSASGRLRR